MPTVLLDGERHEFEASTWGELLTVIDQQTESRSVIVVEVRFDGIEEPAFREPAALEHRLDDFATVEVTTGPPELLLDRCIGEAVGAVSVLCAAAASVGEQYRMYDVDEANRGLVELADGMGSLIAIAGAATIATKDDAESEGRREALNGLVAELSWPFRVARVRAGVAGLDHRGRHPPVRRGAGAPPVGTRARSVCLHGGRVRAGRPSGDTGCD